MRPNSRRSWPRKLPLRAGVGKISRGLGHARARIGDKLLTWLTALFAGLTFIVIPLHSGGLIEAQGYGFLIVVIMAGCILGDSAGLWAVSIMLAGIGLGAAASLARFMNDPALGLYLDVTAWITTGTALAYVVTRAVFGPGRITYHRVVGAVLLYLTIGQIFVGLYALAGFLLPRAFAGIEFVEGPKLISDLTYFSFATLTTLGYGDIVPLHPLTRSLSNLEAIIGQIYPATLLARLVTLELEERRR